MGRIDKKFCDDNCRALFHNKNNPHSTAVKEINAILKRNHQILNQFLTESGSSQIHIPYLTLALKGFNPGFFTHIDHVKPDLRFCYDTGFQQDPSGFIKIEKLPFPEF